MPIPCDRAGILEGHDRSPQAFVVGRERRSEDPTKNRSRRPRPFSVIEDHSRTKKHCMKLEVRSHWDIRQL
jgi:hypothetical protein